MLRFSMTHCNAYRKMKSEIRFLNKVKCCLDENVRKNEKEKLKVVINFSLVGEA